MINVDINTIEANSNFDMSVIDDALFDIKRLSYHSLYNYQRTATGITRIDVDMSTFRSITINKKPNRVFTKQANIQFDLVPTRSLTKYKHSALNGATLTIDTIKNNANIFNRIPVVFIDGKFVDFVKFIVRQDETIVLVDENDYKFTTGKMMILFVPNAVYGVYETNYTKLKMYVDRLNPYYKKVLSDTAFDTIDTYKAAVTSKGYMFSSMIRSTQSFVTPMLSFIAGNDGFDSNNKQAYLNISGVSSFVIKLAVSKSNGKFYVKIPDMEMPIPAENLIPISSASSSSLVYKVNHDITLIPHYHGIYELVNAPEDTLIGQYISFLVFYNFEKEQEDDIKFVRDIDKYLKLMNVNESNINTDTVNSLVKGYMPDKFEYSINDFNGSSYETTLLYKVNKLAEWFDKYPQAYRTYLEKLVDRTGGFYVDMSQLNYESKLRNDSYGEFIDTSKQLAFNDQRVLLIIKNEDRTKKAFRTYVDGVYYYCNDVLENGNYDYYYMPTSIVKPDSFVEFETFSIFTYTEELTLSSTSTNTTIKPVLDANEWFSRNDIFVTTVDGTFLDKADYEISYLNEDNVKIVLSDDSFKKITNNTFIFRLKNTNYLDQPIELYVTRHAYVRQFPVTSANVIDESLYFKSAIQPEKRNIRIFRNGRFINPELYSFYPSKTKAGYSIAIPGILEKSGDLFVLDYTPNKYKVVYSQETIPAHGIVDLSNKLDKPLGLQWYDIYLNGKRLSSRDITFISANIMSISPSVGTVKNLLIVERSVDTPIFSVKGKTDITDTLWATDPEFSSAMRGVQGLDPNGNEIYENPINDVEEDIVTEILGIVDLQLKEFLKNVIAPIEFINPDVMQLTDADYNAYPDYFQSPDFFFINPDNTDNMSSGFVLFIDGDEEIHVPIIAVD